MSMAKLVRYLTIVGAFVILLSFPLEWVVFIEEMRVVDRPTAILLLGLALQVVSFVPANERSQRMLTPILVLSGLMAVFIVLWSVVYTALNLINSADSILGAGPLVAISGLSLYIIGLIGTIQVLQTKFNSTNNKQRYHITGVE